MRDTVVYHSLRDWTESWCELFWKNHKANLSNDGRKYSYKLVYENRNGNTLKDLEANIHNSKIDAIEMRKMAMLWKKLKISTVKQCHDYLVKKWTAIYEAEK